MGYYAGKREGIPSDLMGILTQASAGTKSTATKTLGVTAQTAPGAAAAPAGGKLYCCKKCDEATKAVKRYTAPTPCAAPAVACTAADPVCTGGGGGGEDPGSCLQKCTNEYAQDHDARKYLACQTACGGGGGGDDCASNCQKQYPGAANQIALMKCLAACKGPETTCTKDTDCPAGEKCVAGRCKGITPITPPIDCKGSKIYSGAVDADCPCGQKILMPGGNVGSDSTKCPSGYWADGIVCKCSKLKQGGDGGGEFDWSGDLTDFWKMLMTKGKGLLTDYAYPEDLQTLLTGLTARGQEFLGRKPGFSDTMLTNILGSNLDKIRGAGNASRQDLLSSLQSEGMLGTGAGMGLINKGSWNTEGNVSNTLRDLALANEAQKRSDIESYTGLASGLAGQRIGAEQGLQSINLQRGGLANQMFGSGMTFEQLKEAINAARRGEGNQSMAMLIQYLISLMSGWK